VEQYSSGTLAAAATSSISNFPAIAVSYGIIDKPIPEGVTERAHELAIRTIEQLWQSGFEHKGPDAPVFYSINVPVYQLSFLLSLYRGSTDNTLFFFLCSVKLTTGIFSKDTPISWTTIGTVSYDSLFVPSEEKTDEVEKEAEDVGPGAIADSDAEQAASSDSSKGKLQRGQKLSFKFSPVHIQSLLNPTNVVRVLSLTPSLSPLRALLIAHRHSF
jgi:hypothetical protein